MNRVRVSITILITVMLLSILGLWYLHNTQQEMTQLLTQAYAAAEVDDYDGAEQLAEEFDRTWHRHEQYLILYIRHHQIDEITSTSARLAPLAANGEEGEFLAECKKILATLEHIYESEKFSLKSVL